MRTRIKLAFKQNISYIQRAGRDYITKTGIKTQDRFVCQYLGRSSRLIAQVAGGQSPKNICGDDIVIT
jgi:hypothetical protein